jgi:aspartyl-tRNA(Asn)/glutamyl-tRNA(Gln) amidotransferase subunit A
VTTGGSKVWQDRLSTTTATLVRKVKAAGMIVIGKTHSVEFAMGLHVRMLTSPASYIF